MARVGAQLTFAGTVHEAETCWYEVSRWPDWVDGLDRVIEVSGDWPRQGATVTWESGPAGRGRVIERVVSCIALRLSSLGFSRGRGRDADHHLIPRMQPASHQFSPLIV